MIEQWRREIVGEQGGVIGVDMTENQVAVAKEYIEYHRNKFGYAKTNVDFKLGFIEHLSELSISSNSIDVIVSNCVINLSPDKEAVLREAYRVLKHGGELYFSDVYSDRRIPSDLIKDPTLYGECLSGALYWNDFIKLARKVGFNDPRLVKSKPLLIHNQRIESVLGHIKFYSATYRLFKITELETDCEDYGQAVIYKGTLATCPSEFILDKHHLFPTLKVFSVCRNTYLMLKESRFSKYFEFIGEGKIHYGLFAGCGGDILPFSNTTSSSSSSCC